MGSHFDVGVFVTTARQAMLTAKPPLSEPKPAPAMSSHGQHTNIFPGLEFGADGHLIVATADDLRRAGDITISEAAATTVMCGFWLPARAVLSFL